MIRLEATDCEHIIRRMKSSDRHSISTEIQVMYFDSDASGAVRDIAYLRFIETARTLLALRMGMSFREILQTKIHPVVVRTEIEYKKPAFLGDIIFVNGRRYGILRRSFLGRLRDHPPGGQQLAGNLPPGAGLDSHAGRPTGAAPSRIPGIFFLRVVSGQGRWHLPLLLALAVALTLGTAGWGDLYNETDGQYGGAAKMMVRSGSWLIPENDGIPRLVKPPLLYWAIAISMKTFGINEFAGYRACPTRWL